MKVRSLRWGYGKATAESSMDADTVVELCISANDRHNYFILVIRRGNVEEVAVCTLPMFDIILQTHHHDVDAGEELSKYAAAQAEVYRYEIGAPSPDMAESAFAAPIHLARAAMQEYYSQSNDETDLQRAQEFIAPYAGKKFEKFKLPKLFR
ncbi:MAG: hypothetical protein IIZ39_10110 [Blautia sp.]|nr:hypothetical protein [Aeriscardovia sp.]MBQ1492300.1 hypothetical protein [Blautia sp.]